MVPNVRSNLAHNVSLLYAYWLCLDQRICDFLPVGQVCTFHIQGVLTVD